MLYVGFPIRKKRKLLQYPEFPCLIKSEMKMSAGKPRTPIYHEESLWAGNITRRTDGRGGPQISGSDCTPEEAEMACLR